MMLQSRMQDFVREYSTKRRRVEAVHEVWVVEERDAVRGHGLNRPALPPLQPEQERAEEGMVEQKCGARLLEAAFGCHQWFHAAAPM